jgi:hypothetical protein
MEETKQNNQSPTPEEWRRATDYALSMSSNMTQAEQGESKKANPEPPKK